MTVVNKYKLCPDCAEQVRAAARLCRFCGYSFLTGQSGLRANRAGALPLEDSAEQAAALGRSVAKPLAALGRSVAKPLAELGRSVAKPLAELGRSVAKPLAELGRSEAKPLAELGRSVAKPLAELDKAVVPALTDIGEQVAPPDEESPTGQTVAPDRLAGWRAVEGAPGARLPARAVATLLERGDDRLPPQMPSVEETEIITSPDSSPAPEPLEDGPVVLERLPTLPVVPEKGPFGFGLPALAAIALIAVGIVFYLLVINPAAPPLASPSPTSVSRSFVLPTPGPLEIAASYQSFVGDADTFYGQSTPFYAQLQGEIANGTATSATAGNLVTNFQMFRDTLDAISPAPCFSALYQQMVALNSRALGDAQALAAAGPGTDLSPLSASLGSDLDSWQTFLSAQLTTPRCGAVAATAKPSGSSSSSIPSISSTP